VVHQPGQIRHPVTAAGPYGMLQASSTSGVAIWVAARQPMILRENASMTNAT